MEGETGVCIGRFEGCRGRCVGVFVCGRMGFHVCRYWGLNVEGEMVCVCGEMTGV